MTDKTMRSTTRRVLIRNAAVLAPLAAAAGLGSAAAQEKLPPAMVLYQTTPKDGKQCNQCLHWQPPAGCAIVAGVIAPTGWCGVFAPKEGG
jgi:hypothetical protein